MAGQALREQIVDLHARCLTDIKQRPHKRENPVRRTTWRYTQRLVQMQTERNYYYSSKIEHKADLVPLAFDNFARLRTTQESKDYRKPRCRNWVAEDAKQDIWEISGHVVEEFSGKGRWSMSKIQPYFRVDTSGIDSEVRL
jgi:hypothetical protein